MELKIKKEFRDKITGEKYKTGKIVEFEEDRAEELLADRRGLVEKVAETPAEKPAEKPAVRTVSAYRWKIFQCGFLTR